MYKVSETNKTPNIEFNPEQGIVSIIGRSIHEDPKEYYRELFQVTQSFLASKPAAFKLIFELVYFNSSSAIIFRDYIRLFDDSGAKVTVEWRYEEDDDEMRGSGEEFNHLFDNIEFNLVVT